MAYTSKGARVWEKLQGTESEKLAAEFSAIDAEIDVHKSKFAVLSAAQGTITALATAGVDLADGNDTSYYGVFFAPVALTVITLHYYLTEAYVKDTTDAKIELYDDAAEAVKIFGKTLTVGGEAAKSHGEISPESGKSSIAEGTRLDLVITATDSGSGTGHAVIILEYVESHS